MYYKNLLNNNQQLNFIDTLSIASFVIGLMNLDENLTQNDKQELMKELANKSDLLLKEIHRHLQNQDKKLDMILQELKKSNDDRRNLSGAG